MRKLQQALIGAAIAIASASVPAVQVFDFTLTGEAHVPSSESPFPLVFRPVTGTARVTLADGGDGVYTGASFQSFFAFVETGSGSYAEGHRSETLMGSGFTVDYFGRPSYVRVADGRISGIFIDPTPYYLWLVSGLHINVPLFGDRDWGALVQLVDVTPVPEPETWALLLAGMAGLGYTARRRRHASE